MNDVVFLGKQPVRDEARKRQLHQAADDQAGSNQICDRRLELGHQKRRHNHGGTEDTDHQDTDDGEYPGTGTNHAGVGIGFHQPQQGVFFQQFAQLEANACHQRVSTA